MIVPVKYLEWCRVNCPNSLISPIDGWYVVADICVAESRLGYLTLGHPVNFTPDDEILFVLYAGTLNIRPATTAEIACSIL